MSGWCWDCAQRRGTIPAVEDHKNGLVYKICTLCHHKWRRYLKGGGPSEGFTVVIE